MRYSSINLMVPTYKRVGNGKLPRHIKSFLLNASNLSNIRYTFLVNHDDEETLTYLRGTKDVTCEIQFFPTKETEPHLGKFYNEMYARSHWAEDPACLVSMIGDDMVCETRDWDERVLESANAISGMGVIHCRDGIQNGRIAVNLFTSRKWIEAIGGQFMPEYWAADFIDVVHTEIARRSGKEIYLDNVVLSHEHFSKTGDKDETSARLRAKYDGVNATAIAEGYINACLQKLKERQG